MKKSVMRLAIVGVLICLCVLPITYSAIFPPPLKTKLFFLDAPSALVQYGPDSDFIVVLAANVISSSYGPFKFLIVEQGWCDGIYDSKNQTNAGCNGVWHYVDHWYTNNVFAARKYALLTVNAFSDEWNVWDSYDVNAAVITMGSSSADHLSVSVLAWTRTGKIAITANYLADARNSIIAKLRGGLNWDNPGAQFTGETAQRVLQDPPVSTVTGVDFGQRTYSYGIFRYIHTELYDPSLLS